MHGIGTQSIHYIWGKLAPAMDWIIAPVCLYTLPTMTVSPGVALIMPTQSPTRFIASKALQLDRGVCIPTTGTHRTPVHRTDLHRTPVRWGGEGSKTGTQAGTGTPGQAQKPATRLDLLTSCDLLTSWLNHQILSLRCTCVETTPLLFAGKSLFWLSNNHLKTLRLPNNPFYIMLDSSCIIV